VHCHDARLKYQAKVQVFSNRNPHYLASISKKQWWFTGFDLIQEVPKEYVHLIKNHHCHNSGYVAFWVSVMLIGSFWPKN
jgi:hypothetical protein